MSWELLILGWPAEFETLDDLPKDYEPRPLGSIAEIVASLSAGVPEIDLSDPTWGFLRGDDWSIELSIGNSDPCQSIMLHVRGGDGAIGGIAAILKAIGFQAYDIQAGKAFKPGARSEASFAAWRDYRALAAKSLDNLISK
jgi:hypothetical protein